VVLAIAGLLVAGVSVVAADVPAPTPTPTPAPTVTPPAPVPPGATTTFYGRGYGHGLGMSQYGARGRALAGQDAATILTHYYPGTTLAATDPNQPVRILVLSRFKSTAAIPLRLYGRGAPWTIDGVDGTFPQDALLRVIKIGSGLRVIVADATGTTLLDRVTGGMVLVRPGAAATGRIQVWSKPGVYDTYRGVIRLLVSGTGVDVVNETTLDLYLLGVVPAEMSPTWPTEALRAQAIAARSYAARRLHPAIGTFDLFDDSRTQVYRGSVGEKPGSSAAVADTTGQILMSGTAIVEALFHSDDGGATENNENVYVSSSGGVFVQPVPYLRGSPDRAPDGTSYDAGAPRATWQTASYTLDQLSAVFAADARTNVGALTALTALNLTNRGVSGRLISVTLTGSAGTKTVSGEIFRYVFNTFTPDADPYMWSTLVDTAPIP
jgi:stage II sporulation protein D